MKAWLKENLVLVVAGGLGILVVTGIILAKVFEVPLSEADVEALKGLQGSMVAETAKHGFSNSMALVETHGIQALVTPDKIQRL